MQHSVCNTKCAWQWGFGGSREGAESGGVGASPQCLGSLEDLPKNKAIRGGAEITYLSLSAPQNPGSLSCNTSLPHPNICPT